MLDWKIIKSNFTLFNISNVNNNSSKYKLFKNKDFSLKYNFFWFKISFKNEINLPFSSEYFINNFNIFSFSFLISK